ncbi:type VI secretion system Vgr family protein [Rhodoferax aquaticus]|uniref:Type VI secretion system tip protein VgrG n=1 Tax=Rhodoferax aquaticus TaxID=2527691 RepID=A0A515EPZ0_9BURK|nr:type VI secretion system Vgr family protein [Rhodoferax aquaticus]QDL54690.1 type VI secretion system tip protein VgrG [Rhodoferax aquaticus]
MPTPSLTSLTTLIPAERILTISSASLEAQAGHAQLQAVRLEGHEGINQLFRYQLTLQTPDTPVPGGLVELDLQALMGQAISCHIQLEGMGTFEAGSIGGVVKGQLATPHQGSGVRQISALITAATLIQETPRQRVYQLTLEPWLAQARLKSDCKVFQDMSPVAVIEHVLANYPQPSTKRLIESYPVRDYCVQYNETDLQFITRLMQEWGINYHFEHSGEAHRLIWSDHNGAFQIRQEDLQQNSADPGLNPYHTIPYYPLGHKTDREYIHRFSPVQRLTASAYASADYDYTRPQASLAVQASSDHAGNHPAHQIYLWRGANSGVGGGAGGGANTSLTSSDYSQPNAGAGAGVDAANHTEPQGQHLARLRLQALRQGALRARGAGHIRGIVPGSSFTLAEHPQTSANTEYIVLHTTLDIENPSEHKTGSTNTQDTTQGQWRVHTEFEVQPSTIALRPDGTQSKPLIPGPLSALVVGPAGANHHTDYLSRIKVHFPWDRHDARDQRSSCWVRVASPWAGNQLGAIHIPRIGQEVLVSFEGGDPDKPIVIASVYNQNNQPPWELPGQQALSGIRSRELTAGQGNAAAGRSNHVLLDDTAEQIQVQAKSDHQHSQLSLGHITRIESGAGRQEHRGEGFELRTDGHGAIRAQDGLLITTEGRPNAQGHVKALSETAARLSQAQEQHRSLGNLAAQHQAQEAGEGADQGEVASALQMQNDSITGKTAKDTAHPELTEPHLVLASPAGIESTTAGSTHQHSQAHHAISAGGHVSTSTAKSWLLSAKETIKLFAYMSGIKLVSARDDMDIQALQTNIHLLAKMDITMTANEVHLLAQKNVLLNGSGSHIEWQSGGMTEGTNGSRAVHAGQHGVVGAASVPLPPPQFPSGVCKECVLAAAKSASGLALANR